MQDISVKNQGRKILVAGPCVATSLQECVSIAEKVKEAGEKYGFYPIFKASFDKANRTSDDSFRGLGMKMGISIFSKLRDLVDIPIITDVHEKEHVTYLKGFVDYLQVPAFLSRQTDLIHECAKSGLPTLVKKGQFLSPESCSYIEKKFYKAGGKDLMICERGTTFGYNDLIVDVTSLTRLKKSCPDSKIIMDCTHSLQKPNGIYGKTEGNSEYIEDMVKFASIMNSDGIFIEVHPNPKESPSDSDNILELDKLDSILSVSKKIYGL